MRGRLSSRRSCPAASRSRWLPSATPSRPGSQPLLADESAVASLVYRQGFRSIVVTTRPFGEGRRRGGRPVHGLDARQRRPRRPEVVVRSGWLTGAARPCQLPARSSCPTSGRCRTVSSSRWPGDVTRRELLQIAGSLEPYGVWRTGQVFTDVHDGHARPTTSRRSATSTRAVSTIDSRRYSREETEEALDHEQRDDRLLRLGRDRLGVRRGRYGALGGVAGRLPGSRRQLRARGGRRGGDDPRRESRARGVLLGRGAEYEDRRREAASVRLRGPLGAADSAVAARRDAHERMRRR